MGESTSLPCQTADIDDTLTTIHTDVLIVGTGPAGASLAAFLASHGSKGLIIGATSSTAETPRAHFTNVGTMECYRDIGLEEECIKAGTSGDHYQYWRWCHSLAGEEYARTFSFGNDPRRKGDYEIASPCKQQDLVQTLSEPILLRYATQNGFQCRFDTTMLGFVEDPKTNTVRSTVLDNITGHKLHIISKYLAGADGARSEVVKKLGLPMTHSGRGGGIAFNILVEAEMTHLMQHNRGLLHGISRPDEEPEDHAWAAVARMVKPWHEWLFVYFAKPGVVEVDVTDDQWCKTTKKFIGDDSVDVKVKNVSKWKINESYADVYSKGNVFCLGDAVHRHPPQNGLGSNTCIQDAYNLAWKMAYVLQSKADRRLLDSYNVERQPVGKFIVTRANDSLGLQMVIWSVLGFTEPELSHRKEILAEFRADSEAGRKRRAAFQKAMEETKYEHHGLGAELNQQYCDPKTAVFLDDEETGPPTYETYDDRFLYYQPSTYPGCRLPHAWLNKAVPTRPTSTHDLAGKGSFAILTGIGGKDAWTKAASQVGQKMNIRIRVTSIGWRQDFEDPFFDWQHVKAIEDNGAVLVRPDRTVAWRCKRLMGAEGEMSEKLSMVLRRVLGFQA